MRSTEATEPQKIQQKTKYVRFDGQRNWPNEEAAEYLGCTPDTLKVWVSKRRVPFVRVGRLVRFRKADLDAWLEDNAVPAEGR